MPRRWVFPAVVWVLVPPLFLLFDGPARWAPLLIAAVALSCGAAVVLAGRRERTVTVVRGRALDAPADALWPLLVDPERAPSFVPGCVRGHAVATPAGARRRYALVDASGRTVVHEVLEERPGQRLASAVVEPAEPPHLRTAVDLSPDGAGCRVVLTTQAVVPKGMVLRPGYRGRQRAAMDAVLRRLGAPVRTGGG